MPYLDEAEMEALLAFPCFSPAIGNYKTCYRTGVHPINAHRTVNQWRAGTAAVAIFLMYSAPAESGLKLIAECDGCKAMSIMNRDLRSLP